MPEQNLNQNNTETPEDIEKLRKAVLKWVEAEKTDKQSKKLPFKELKEKISTVIKEVEDAKPASKPQNKIVVPPVVRSNKNQQLLTKDKKIKGKRVGLLKLIILIIVVLILGLIIFGIGIYQFKWQNSLVIQITKIIPYPAAVVNYRILPYYGWQKQGSTLENFYLQEKENTPDFQMPTNQEIQKHILTRMIEKELLNQLAEKYKISV